MPKMKHLFSRLAVMAAVLVCGICPVFGVGWKTLPGHVPAASKNLSPTGRLPATNELRLAIGVPLRDPAGLETFLAQVYDPASPNYRQFLTPEEFTARFGPTEQDYQAVKEFARTNGLQIIGTHGNRLLLDVRGRVADVERAFHFNLRKFKHPTEAREFFAPDAEPTVDAALRMADVSGLSDYSRPHPKIRRLDVSAGVLPKNGSGSGGAYLGNDFRNAYVPGTTLTGAGQMVGLLQFDGFYSSDIAAYATAAGIPAIPLQTISVDGYNGVPTPGANSGNGEVSLDIEMTMAMAPGLAKIVVFEADPNGGNANTILASMVTNTAIKQFSCSWGWSGGPSTTTDNYFKQMASQGQSFFNASGDSDAFTTGAGSVNGVDNTSLNNAPSSSPYITQVGGTTLTMNGTGASYASETVWNRGGGVGSSGGISSYYAIPSWQTNISMTASKGSTTKRNIPDVALTSESVYVYYGNGSTGTFGGTSCAAPLWAGFMALVNQQAANQGNPSAGFINPAVYALGTGPNSSLYFHDTTKGDNTWSSSSSQFYAVPGYDLCTGWGTPTGTNLIIALAGPPDTLFVAPAAGFMASGVAGGPFAGGTQVFTLTNAGGAALSWSLINTSAWLTVSNVSGALAGSRQTNVAVSLTAAANTLALGTYTASISFSNQSTHAAQLRQFTLQVLQALVFAPANGFTASGPVGGAFNVASQNYVLTNLGAVTLNWGVVNTSAWLAASSAGGALAGGANTTLVIGLSAAANALPAGIYSATVLVTNQGGANVNLNFNLSVGQSLVQNGGFETGDFTGWSQSGNTAYTTVTGGNALYAHSGTYGVQAGPVSTPGYLAQVRPTTPGQAYLLSFWLSNPTSGSTELFQASWNGTNAYAITNPPVMAWTNLNFVVTATGTNTTLQFALQNDLDYFGLDDVSVTPIPTPTFTGFSKKTNGLSLTWNALAGVVYQVQYKTNLLQTNWIILSTNTATGNTISFTNTISADPRRFYRVRRLP